MPTSVFFTVDTEIIWRHHVAGHDVDTLFARSFEPGGVGVSYQLGLLQRHGLKATYFVDPMPALVYGLDPFKRLIETILAAGQEVQLHLHPNWIGAKAGDNGNASGPANINELTLDEQRDLLGGARDLLVAAGAPVPIAFRGGNYGANDDTLTALVDLAFQYDTSHNGAAHPWPSAITLAESQIAPIEHQGIIEVPVTLIEDAPGRMRHFQICALSAAEMRAALDHATDNDHAALTIVNHGFELANRNGTAPNAVHVSRFEALCAMLADRRDALPTTHFADRPVLDLDREDRPMGASLARRRWRQAEQLWSNLVAERVA